MADYICVGLSQIDVTARPGQPMLQPIATMIRRGGDMYVAPHDGQESNPNVIMATDRCMTVMSAKGSAKKFWEHIQLYGLSGRTSVSNQFKIKADNFGELIIKLRDKGFPVSPQE